MSDLLRSVVEGQLIDAAKPVLLHSVNLTGAASIATLVLKTGGAAGRAIINLQTGADGASVAWSAGSLSGVLCKGIYALLDGGGADFSVEVSGV